VETGRSELRLRLVMEKYRREQPDYVKAWLRASKIWASLFG
jgi:hypothetical protein